MEEGHRQAGRFVKSWQPDRPATAKLARLKKPHSRHRWGLLRGLVLALSVPQLRFQAAWARTDGLGRSGGWALAFPGADSKPTADSTKPATPSPVPRRIGSPAEIWVGGSAAMPAWPGAMADLPDGGGRAGQPMGARGGRAAADVSPQWPRSSDNAEPAWPVAPGEQSLE